MHGDIKKLKTLSDININPLLKKWVLKNKADYSKVCDYLQKINYSLNDLNSEIECLQEIKAKDVVYIICLVDWIKEAYSAYVSTLKENIKKGFTFSKQSELYKANKYFTAIRSFVVAHPLNTDRHPAMGFDGNFICIDIATWSSILDAFYPDKYYLHIDYDGIQRGVKDETDDLILRAYSNDDKMKFSRSITCKMKDIYYVAELYFKALKELSKYLAKQKKADYEGK